MHGKWGNPNQMHFFGKYMGDICDFKSLEMPWSNRRNYDQDYAHALLDINSEVKILRGLGYKFIALGGHSFGANATFAYMATYGDVDAIIALGPGHTPRPWYRNGKTTEVVDKARQLVEQNQGQQQLTLTDLNQGKSKTVSMTATVLLSYFDPNGLGDIPTSAANFKASVPVAWVIGTNDPLYTAGEAYAFSKLPANPKSQYIVVEATHADTPEASQAKVKFWLQGLF